MISRPRNAQHFSSSIEHKVICCVNLPFLETKSLLCNRTPTRIHHCLSFRQPCQQQQPEPGAPCAQSVIINDAKVVVGACALFTSVRVSLVNDGHFLAGKKKKMRLSVHILLGLKL